MLSLRGIIDSSRRVGWAGPSLSGLCALCAVRSSALSLINLRLQCVQTPSTALVNTAYIYTFGVRAATCYTHVITVNAAHSATAHFRQAPHSSLTVSLVSNHSPSGLVAAASHQRTSTRPVWVSCIQCIQLTSLRVSGRLFQQQSPCSSIRMRSQPVDGPVPFMASLHTHPPAPNHSTAITLMSQTNVLQVNTGFTGYP